MKTRENGMVELWEGWRGRILERDLLIEGAIKGLVGNMEQASKCEPERNLSDSNQNTYPLIHI